jgi:hypothetical protein
LNGSTLFDERSQIPVNKRQQRILPTILLRPEREFSLAELIEAAGLEWKHLVANAPIISAIANGPRSELM